MPGLLPRIEERPGFALCGVQSNPHPRYTEFMSTAEVDAAAAGRLAGINAHYDGLIAAVKAESNDLIDRVAAEGRKATADEVTLVNAQMAEVRALNLDRADALNAAKPTAVERNAARRGDVARRRGIPVDEVCGRCHGSGQYLGFGVCFECGGTGASRTDFPRRNPLAATGTD